MCTSEVAKIIQVDEENDMERRQIPTIDAFTLASPQLISAEVPEHARDTPECLAVNQGDSESQLLSFNFDNPAAEWSAVGAPAIQNLADRSRFTYISSESDSSLEGQLSLSHSEYLGSGPSTTTYYGPHSIQLEQLQASWPSTFVDGNFNLSRGVFDNDPTTVFSAAAEANLDYIPVNSVDKLFPYEYSRSHVNGFADQIAVASSSLTAQKSAVTLPSIYTHERIGTQTFDQSGSIEVNPASHTVLGGPLNANMDPDNPLLGRFIAGLTLEHLDYQQESQGTQEFQYLIRQLSVSDPYDMDREPGSCDQDTALPIPSSYRVSLRKPGELVLIPNSFKRRRGPNRKKIESGNNMTGRKGTLRCDACRKRKSKCVFTSEDVACQFCYLRNSPAPCIKKWGQKKEERLSRPMSSLTDKFIPPQDIHLLQYAYSDTFGCFAGAITSRLFKRFTFVFCAPNNQASLREAIFTFSAAFLPPFYEKSEYHSAQAHQALISKSSTSFVETDLFAAGLLTTMHGFFGNPKKFNIYLQGFTTILQTLAGKAASHETLVIRDLILEVSRFIPETSSDLIFSLCQASRDAIGPQSFRLRAHYMNEFFGIESRELAFFESLWQHCRLLRRCFRYAVAEQCEGKFEKSQQMQSTLAEVTFYLESIEVADIMGRMAIRKISLTKQSEEYGSSIFTLLLFRFCRLLIVLRQARTIVYATRSFEAISAATSVIELLRDHPVRYANPSRPDCNLILPRIVCIAGLQFPKASYPERNISRF